MSFTIRAARAADLPTLQLLVRQSYAAMAQHPSLFLGRTEEATWLKSADEAIEAELTEATFEKAYCGDSCLWVAEEPGASGAGAVVGCVGLKREPGKPAELVRMAVLKDARGGGVGAQLIAHVFEHARRAGVRSIMLVTANPRAAAFYAKHGFRRSLAVWLCTIGAIFRMTRAL